MGLPQATIVITMSKAFTKETDHDEDDGPALPPIPAGGKNYITPQGYQRLKDELLELIDNERPKIVEIVHWAASNGDRSENGDYCQSASNSFQVSASKFFQLLRLI